MEFVLAVAVFILLGVALVTAAIWYTNAVWRRFLAPDATPAIAPITIVGADEATIKGYAAGLPAMVVAATNALKSRTNIAIQALGDARAELARLPKPPEQTELPVPSEFREPLSINLKVADIEVGSLLSFLLERSRDPNLVRLTVALGPSGKPSKVYGFLPGAAGYAFVTQAESDLPSIADAIATQFVHRTVQRGEFAFAALDPAAFRKFIDSLETYASLTVERRWIVTGSEKPSEAEVELRKKYAGVLEDVKGLAKRYTAWEGLQWLAAQSAREARDWASAIEFYANLSRLAERGGDVALRDRVTQVTQEAERELAAARARLAADKTGQQLPPMSTALPTGLAVQRVLAAVGLREPGDAARVTVGLIGPVPPREAIGDAKIDVVDGPTSGIADYNLIEHQVTVLQVTRLLAPSATFVFSPSGISRAGTTNDALVDGLRRLIERKPPIILMAWGSSEPNKVIDDLIRQAADKILFVLPAGNDPGPSSYRNVAGVALVVAAATLDGAPTTFTSTGDRVIWAPGADIPVIPPGPANKLEMWKGTSYSAALGAGAAGLLLQAFPQASPAQIRQALLETSRPAQGRTEPRIINVPAATAWLRSRVGGI